ncbi:MAG: type IV toxin-antitoxin system AbiEi family antitoxin domain-containing protein [Actinobacteria bacterium]|nr:type IV toxin-antitoxin system AbiEi family antitoxin domain-containing protein [Actinomycetota bacterium]MBU4403364.1 type IV toxin-antitoxin system AbiEi family antitoxin domain-containing protein [Actinomycetota bacterium]MCG2819847.1 type IV toxin-antitoxin system AbiEi family antitoxin domain-containing protein [Actinomycetes bacterium]
MDKSTTKEAQLLEIVRNKGIIRARDARQQGFHPEYLRRLSKKGLLIHVARGTFIAADAEVTARHTLALAAKLVPGGVVCLLSALNFHGIGDQLPREVWLAMDRKAAPPRVDIPIKVVRFSGDALTEGIDTHIIEGVDVQVFSPAKTIADCFKYRNKIGIDVAVEALVECRAQHKTSVEDIWRYAKICRVANVMKPYLEATQ